MAAREYSRSSAPSPMKASLASATSLSRTSASRACQPYTGGYVLRETLLKVLETLGVPNRRYAHPEEEDQRRPPAWAGSPQLAVREQRRARREAQGREGHSHPSGKTSKAVSRRSAPMIR